MHEEWLGHSDGFVFEFAGSLRVSHAARAAAAER